MPPRREKQTKAPVQSGGAGEDGGPEEAAAYIRESVQDLIQLCMRHRMDTLCYLLDMAKMEAESLIGQHRRPNRS